MSNYVGLVSRMLVGSCILPDRRKKVSVSGGICNAINAYVVFIYLQIKQDKARRRRVKVSKTLYINRMYASIYAVCS